MKNDKYELNLFEFNLILLFNCITLIVKLYTSKNYLYISISSTFEFLIILIIFLLIKKFQKNKNNLLKIILKILFYFILIIDLILNFIHSYFLDDALQVRYNLFTIDFAIIQYFFNEIMPISLIIILSFLIIIILFIAKKIKFSKKIYLLSLRKKNIYIFLTIIFFFLIFNNLFSNTYLNSVIEFKEIIRYKKISLNENNQNYNFKELDKRIENYSNINIPPNQKIIIFVMESVPKNIFEKEIEKIPIEKNFFKLIENNSHIYTNYFTTNQDSSTSILSIISSIFIPMDAYSQNSWEKYEKILKNKTNLIELFNINNYSTNFIVSTKEIPSFIQIYNWENIHNIKNYEEISKNSNILCLQIFENENGCEDKVMEKDLIELIEKTNKSLFIFQELIFGHGIKYEIEKQQSISSYYNDYFLSIYNIMKEKKLLENTTIIISSDHGLRNLQNKKNPNAYQIPLIIYNLNFEKKEIKELKNHLDFKEILLSEINSIENIKNSNLSDFKSKENIFGENNIEKNKEKSYFIGQTRSSIIGMLSNSGNFTYIKKNEKDYWIIYQKNINLNQIKEEIYFIEAYKKYFENLN